MRGGLHGLLFLVKSAFSNVVRFYELFKTVLLFSDVALQGCAGQLYYFFKMLCKVLI